MSIQQAPIGSTSASISKSLSTTREQTFGDAPPVAIDKLSR